MAVLTLTVLTLAILTPAPQPPVEAPSAAELPPMEIIMEISRAMALGKESASLLRWWMRDARKLHAEMPAMQPLRQVQQSLIELSEESPPDALFRAN